ncbi:MAG: adenosine deaminase family protein, partial [Planctomycetota bacterium]
MKPLSESDRSWLERIPKVELHLHLEGAIPLDAMWELVKKYGGDPEVPDRKGLEERFRFRDFHHFIETWVWKIQFTREYDDFAFIAEAVAKALAAQNVRYAEVFFSPGDYFRFGLEPQPLAEAVRTGLSRVEEVEVALIPDLVRDIGPDVGMRIVDQVAEVRDLGLVGIGLGGTEPEFPPKPFAPVYARAREKGFRTTAHAGEAAGPESIWGAIRGL